MELWENKIKENLLFRKKYRVLSWLGCRISRCSEVQQEPVTSRHLTVSESKAWSALIESYRDQQLLFLSSLTTSCFLSDIFPFCNQMIVRLAVISLFLSFPPCSWVLRFFIQISSGGWYGSGCCCMPGLDSCRHWSSDFLPGWLFLPSVPSCLVLTASSLARLKSCPKPWILDLTSILESSISCLEHSGTHKLIPGVKLWAWLICSLGHSDRDAFIQNLNHL